MNYWERTIEDYNFHHTGIPKSVAVSALVERFLDGWDRPSLEELTALKIVSCVDWDDLKESNAWGYADEDKVVSAILEKIESNRLSETLIQN